MSDHPFERTADCDQPGSGRTARPRLAQGRQRDLGVTLPELLIVVSIIGLVVAVLSLSIVVTLNQSSDSLGRLSVARAEQNLGMWLPADLTSASDVDTTPQATPCGESTCDGIVLSNGSNVLMLSWELERPGGGTTPTSVSYQYARLADGEFVLRRVECTAGSCSAVTVLHELPGPPAGAPFVPGVQHGDACTAEVDPVPCTRPYWIITVSEPLAPDAVDDDDLASDENDEVNNANRVVVTISGDGSSHGAGGGVSQISITAGGTERGELDSDALSGVPTLREARSRCAGPIALVIDESNSVGRSVSSVQAGVRTFIESLAGTPVQLQVVRYETLSGVLGSSDWHRYHDMADPSDVSDLLTSVGDLRGSWSTSPRGGTNWEEALFRSFNEPDGSAAATLPETLVFFTDGVPTYDRLVERTSPGELPASPADPGDSWADSDGSGYSQVAFDRANHIANQFRRNVELIGVGIGDEIGGTRSSEWIVDPGAGYVDSRERGYVRYQRVDPVFESRVDFEEGSDPESRADFEHFDRRRWRDVSATEYYTNNVDSSSIDGYRIRGNRGWYKVTQSEFDAYARLEPNSWKYDDWDNVDAATYEARNIDDSPLDGYRIRGTRGWSEVTRELYERYNVRDGGGDGWRLRTTGTTWISRAEYEAGNVSPGAADGFDDVGTERWIRATRALDFFPWPGEQVGPRNQYRTVKSYPATGPYEGFDPPATADTRNGVILARLIAGNDFGTPAIWDGGANGGRGGYTNSEVADLYLERSWDRLPNAMEAIALGACGGTLTVRTQLADGTAPPDPFSFQNSAVTDSAADPVDVEPSVVVTRPSAPAGTFDFTIPDGEHVTVDVVPQNSSALSGYTPVGWSCSAGVTGRSHTPVSASDSGGWDGFRVDVADDEAVSCVLTVDR